MLATAEEIEAFKAGNDFESLAHNLWISRVRILESEGFSPGSLKDFKAFLNKIIVTVLAGPDHPMAVNHRLSIALQGSKVQWQLRSRNPPGEDLADAHEFLSKAAEEFGISVDDERYHKVAKRYKPLFDEAYRRKPKGSGGQE
jgi:hypothetical protein